MFKRCNKCGNIVCILKNNNKILCCNEEMKELKANSVDAAFEKHVPNIEINDNKIKIFVNHVMEDDHYIEWIALESEKCLLVKKLKPNMEATVEFDFIKDSCIYSYCNKHGLWKNDIKN